MVEVEIEKDPLLGTIENFTVGGMDAEVEDFGMVEVSGDCSTGVCHIIRRFIKYDATAAVYQKYGIDQNGYDEVCTRLGDELTF